MWASATSRKWLLCLCRRENRVKAAVRLLLVLFVLLYAQTKSRGLSHQLLLDTTNNLQLPHLADGLHRQRKTKKDKHRKPAAAAAAAAPLCLCLHTKILAICIKFPIADFVKHCRGNTAIATSCWKMYHEGSVLMYSSVFMVYASLCI